MTASARRASLIDASERLIVALDAPDPAEAERLHKLAEQEVSQRWASYEEMATRGPARFAADARTDGERETPAEEGAATPSSS